jgi:hypothetical protein
VKVFLLHRDHDFEVKDWLRDDMYDAMLSGKLYALANVARVRERALRYGTAAPQQRTPEPEDALTQDLELETLWAAMADGDEFLHETAQRATLSSLSDPDAIVYRQQVLADCLAHPDVVRELYRLSIEALENERRGGGFWHTDRTETILNRSVGVLTLHLGVLRRLRQLADQQAEHFSSEGFTRFFGMLRDELTDDYLSSVEEHLRELRFKRGLLESAELGTGDKGRHYIVRRLREQRWTDRLPFGSREPSYTFSIPLRDEAGSQALEEIRSRGLSLVANAVAQAADHIRDFFTMLRLELAFYLGCLNLHESLERKGEPICFPTPAPAGQVQLTATDLYDICLALHVRGRVVGNDVHADEKPLVVITGASQGGKSTLLRSLGLAQLMMQCGMFVGAKSLRASVCAGVFTHYKREEDSAMTGGKLDEELRRMSQIADHIRPRSVLLCNESFASTNEREGSEIAAQVINAMLDKQIRVVFVSHMYELTHGLHAQRRRDALFLRASREEDGRRTFKIVEAAPLPTSYGADSYRRIFGAAEASAADARRGGP